MFSRRRHRRVATEDSGGQVQIVCPETGQLVDTGVRAPSRAALSRMEPQTLDPCPLCGGRHQWVGQDAFIVMEERET